MGTADRLIKKHDCPDCRMCQHCAETRCQVCRGEGPPKLGLSMAEQIARFERLNADDPEYCSCRSRCSDILSRK
ncbi:MAG: hypothetical protein KKC37_04610 [Proteobacteria bacterium]|nr:hypothetical protein [Pseudomonadota bacterium]